MKRKHPRLMISLVTIGLLITGGIVLVTSSMNRLPDFYRQSLEVSREDSVVEGRRFERRLVELSNQIRMEKTWSAVWTQSQINGWLAADLPEKFPKALPKSICQPRVALADDEIKVAFRFHSSGFNGVIQIGGDVFATETENQIAFRIASVRSGLVPVPISWWADRLQESLRNSDIILEWSETEGNPVALVTLPTSFSGGKQRQSILDAVQLTGKGIGLSGRTIRHSDESSRASASDSTDKVQR